VVAEGPREPAMVDHERLLELVTRPTPTGPATLAAACPPSAPPGTNAVLGTSGAPNLAVVPVELGEAVGPTQILNPAGTAESGKTSTQQSFVKYRG
jgi:hypothetical protein